MRRNFPQEVQTTFYGAESIRYMNYVTALKALHDECTSGTEGAPEGVSRQVNPSHCPQSNAPGDKIAGKKPMMPRFSILNYVTGHRGQHPILLASSNAAERRYIFVAERRVTLRHVVTARHVSGGDGA
ncbi:hypothetical protein, partial [Streptomyces halstedii]|uniref:hypothetical protein n=1 Tax=Streptomyces halstedii TaxID=1944 RepID=UPI003812E7A3